MDTIEYKGYKIEIEQDEYPCDPREWDRLGKMLCSHKKYNLGDEELARQIGFNSDDFGGWNEVENWLIKTQDAKVILPLYLYDHSGITISTSPFSCPWDSGQVGLVYATAEQIRKEYNVKSISPKLKTKIIGIIENEVKDYDNYLTGEIYGYTVTDPDGENVITTGDYFGDEGIKECEREGKGQVDIDIRDKAEAKAKQTKAYIINKVPLNKRT